MAGIRDILKPRQLSAAGIGSIVAHIALLGVIIWSAGVHPFQTRTEAITVELVRPDQVPQPAPQDDKTADPSSMPADTSAPAPAASTNEPLPSSNALPAPPPPPTAPQQPAVAPAPPTNEPAPQAAPTPAPAAQPDITEKYGTLFSPIDATFDPDKSTAKLPPEAVAAFRDHLKSCSVLPPQVSRNDRVRIVLRVALLPNGNLAAAPALIEASASPKGPYLMQGAIKALQTCQPHNSLPADQYAEWKVLDLPFTPTDFNGR